ncbi:MAG: thioredoxin family protein [Planctomycetaceae bacterium]
MRRDRSLIIGPVLLILLAMPIGETARGNDSSVWMHDPQAALAEAKRLNRPVLLHFHAAWCVPCQTMDRGVLNQRGVLDALARDFVAVKVDYDRHTELAEQLEIATLPSDVFLYPDGRPFARVSKPADLSLYLNRLVAARDRFEQWDRQRHIATESNTDAPEPRGRSSARLARGERQRIGLDGF